MPRQGVAFGNGRDKDKVQADQKVQAFGQPCKLQGAFVFNRIDLLVSGDFDVAGTARTLSITTVGAPFGGKVREEGTVYRLDKVPHQPTKYRYLVVSDKIEERADVVTIRDFRRTKEKLKKIKKGTGLEITIAPAKKMDAAGVGKWFEDIRELYSFCHSSECQLILSSGATSMHEMVSGPCFDAILRNCGIDPGRHWHEMNRWLETRLARRVSV